MNCWAEDVHAEEQLDALVRINLQCSLGTVNRSASPLAMEAATHPPLFIYKLRDSSRGHINM